MFGIQAYLDRFPGDRCAQRQRDVLADKLLNIYRVASAPGWNWFEESLSYSNARLPEALLLAGSRTSNEDWLAVGLESLEWLEEQQGCTINASLCRSAPMVSIARAGEKLGSISSQWRLALPSAACLQAYRATGDERWHNKAWAAFNWFIGDNDLKTPYTT